MGIYLTPEFQDERRKARINDKILCKAAKSFLRDCMAINLAVIHTKSGLDYRALGHRMVRAASFSSIMATTCIFLICI